MLAIAGWINGAAAGGAELSDSGWAVATPSVLGHENRPADPSMRIVIDQVLEQTRVPLLTKPAPQPPRAPAGTRQPLLPGAGSRFSRVPGRPASDVRTAQRPAVANGWRPGDSWHASRSQASNPTGSSAATAEAPAEPTSTPVDSGPPAFGTPTNSGTSGDGQPALPAHSAEPTASEMGPQAANDDHADGGATAQHDPSGGEQDSTSGGAEPELAAAAPADEAAADERIVDGQTADERGVVEGASEPIADDGQPDDQPQVEVTLPPLTRQLMSLRIKLRKVLKAYYRQALNNRDHDPWEIMHAMLAYELHSRVLQGGPRGAPITSVGWLCYNMPCKGQSMLYVTPEGELRAKYGVGLQGHMGQLLAMLAQCGVSPDYPIRVGKNEFTVHDLIAAEQKTCYGDTELTFKLIGLAHYLDLDTTWVNDKGETWDFPRLIREELAQPIRGAACGGTHRLAGLGLAVKARVRRGQPLDGEFARAAELVEKYHLYAFRLQNRDGSLSTEWFRGRGDDPDINRRVRTTGHILEWLIYSLRDEELRDWRTIAAVSYLTNLLYSNYDNEWEVGPVSHALHALALYDQRVFQPYDQQPSVASSAQDKRATTTRSRSYSARR